MENSNNIIILRNVFKITEMAIEPVLDPKTRRYPDSVKKVDSNGDMIISDVEKNSNKIYIAENESIVIKDGKTFDLEDPYDFAWWEAIKNSRLIADYRDAKDANGNPLIDGGPNRYGVATFYVERPGVETKNKNAKKRKVFQAQRYIFEDTKEGIYMKARLLGTRMDSYPLSDVEAYLLEQAESNSDKIIALYTGGDTHLMILLLDAIDKGVIVHKNKQFYQYGESTILGASQDACIAWMKNAVNKRMMDLIRSEVYPEEFKGTNNLTNSFADYDSASDTPHSLEGDSDESVENVADSITTKTNSRATTTRAKAK